MVEQKWSNGCGAVNSQIPQVDQEATTMLIDGMESGSGKSAVAGGAEGAGNASGFGDMAEPLHGQVHTVWVNEAQDAVGTFADGLSDVEDVSALPQKFPHLVASRGPAGLSMHGDCPCL